MKFEPKKKRIKPKVPVMCSVCKETFMKDKFRAEQGGPHTCMPCNRKTQGKWNLGKK